MSHRTDVPEIDHAFNGGLPPGIVVIEDKTGEALRLLDHANNVVEHSVDVDSIRQHFQAGTNLLVVPLMATHGGVPASLETTLGVVRGEHSNRTLILVVDLASTEMVRLADIAITVSGSTWHIIKSRALGTIKSSQFEVVPRPAVNKDSVRIPTGLVALDAALGGGMPQGLVVMRGNRENIARVRKAMSNGSHFQVLFRHDRDLDTLRDAVGYAVSANARDKEMLILDFGDLTKKFPFDPAQVRGPMISVSERAVDSIKPVCVLIEAHINREADAVLTDVADVVLKATDEGPWYVQKPYGGKMVAFEAAEKFDPLEVPQPPKQPMTPDRVLNALLSDPALFIAVAKRMKVAQPWEAVGKDWFQRAEVVFDFNVLTVRKEQKGWLWSFFIPMEGSNAEEAKNGGFFPTAEEAKKAGDDWLRRLGWYVL